MRWRTVNLARLAGNGVLGRWLVSYSVRRVRPLALLSTRTATPRFAFAPLAFGRINDVATGLGTHPVSLLHLVHGRICFPLWQLAHIIWKRRDVWRPEDAKWRKQLGRRHSGVRVEWGKVTHMESILKGLR